MNRRDIAVIALRVMSLYYLAEIVTFFPSLFYTRWQDWTVAALSILPFVARIGLSWWLWVWAPALAVRILPGEAPQEFPAAQSIIESLQTVAFSVLGLGVATVGFSTFMNACFMYVQATRMVRFANRTIGSDPDRFLLFLAASFIEMLAGMWLFFNAGAVSRFWQRRQRPQPSGNDGVDA